MAITKLSKNITRESTHIADEREIIVTLLESQEIELRLKGLKTGAVKISVAALWEMLNNTSPSASQTGKGEATISTAQDWHNDDLISISDLQSSLAVEDFEYNVHVRIMKNLKDCTKFIQL